MTSDKSVSWRLVDSYLLVNGNKVFLTCVTGLPSPIPGINPLHVLPSFSLFPFQRRMKTWLLWAQAPFLSALRNLAHRSAISMCLISFSNSPAFVFPGFLWSSSSCTTFSFPSCSSASRLPSLTFSDFLSLTAHGTWTSFLLSALLCSG